MLREIPQPEEQIDFYTEEERRKAEEAAHYYAALDTVKELVDKSRCQQRGWPGDWHRQVESVLQKLRNEVESLVTVRAPQPHAYEREESATN